MSAGLQAQQERLAAAVGDPQSYPPGVRDAVGVLVDRHVTAWAESEDGWALLPVGPSPPHMELIGNDREAMQRGLEICRAFIGPPAGFEPPRSVGAGLLSARLSGGPELPRQLQAALEISDFLRTRSEPPAAPAQGLSALLRDFELRLQDPDAEEDAEYLLQQLQQDPELSLMNKRFLQVALLAAYGRWPELRRLAGFSELAKIQCPARVSNALLECLWQTDLGAFLDPQDLLRRYGDAGIGTRYPELLSRSRAAVGAGAQIMIALRAHEKADRERLERLEVAGHPEVARVAAGLIATLAGAAGTTVSPLAGPVGGLDRMRTAFNGGDWAAAVAAAPEAGGGDEAVALLIRAAYNADDLDCTRAALDTLKEWGIRSVQARDLRVLLLQLRESVDNPAPSGWAGWLEDLGEHPRPATAADAAIDSAEVWTAELARPGATADDLPRLLLAAADRSPAAVSRALGPLVDLATTLLKAGTGKQFSLDLLLLLGVQETLTPAVLDAHVTMAARVLESSPGNEEARAVIDSSRSMLRSAPPSAFGTWLLDVLDVLLDHGPGSVESEIRTFAGLTLAELKPRWRRLDATERLRGRELMAECGLDAGLPAEESTAVTGGSGDPVAAELNASTVGLYTMQSGVRTRFSRMVQQRAPGADLRHNAEKDASPTLRSFAKGSRWLVVDVAHATHAATGCIDAVRPLSEQIRTVRNGASGLFAALVMSVLDSFGPAEDT